MKIKLDIEKYRWNKKLFIHIVEQCDVSFYYYDKDCNKIECNSKEDRAKFLSFLRNDEIKLYVIAAPLEWHNRVLPDKLHDNYLEEILYYLVKDGENEYYISEPYEWEKYYEDMSDEDLAHFGI